MEKQGCNKRIEDAIHEGMYRICGEDEWICPTCEVDKLNEEQGEIVMKAMELLRENKIPIWLYTDLTYDVGMPY